MANVNITVTVDSGDAPDILAAIESIWKSQTVNLFFQASPDDYEALTSGQKAKALLRAFLITTTRNYRRELAVAAIPPVTDPSVT